MADILEGLRRVNGSFFHAMTLPEAQSACATATEALEVPRAALARDEEFDRPAADGAVLRARLYAHSHKGLPLLLCLLGGGFTIGNLEKRDSLGRQLSLRGNVAAVAVAYRLAPEHRFSRAVRDARSAMQEPMASGAALGLGAIRLAVRGDSAGGTLAADCAIRARDIDRALRLRLLIAPGTAAQAASAMALKRAFQA